MPSMRCSSIFLALTLAAASLSAETWDLSTIDGAGMVGQHASIAARFGRTHVAYYDVTNGDLKYAASDDDKSWMVEVVDGLGDVGEFASIAVDLKGIPHISYHDRTSHDLKYAVKSGSKWTIDVVDAGFAGQFTSIAVDSAHRAYISYHDMAANDLEVAYGKPGSWTITLVDSIGSVGWGSSIALDKDERAHVSYNDNATNTLRYATNAGGAWSVTYLDPIEVAPPTAIAIDGSGAVHIAFLSKGVLSYAHNASGTFVTETVDESIGPEEYDVAIALTGDGRPAITYYDAPKTQLRLARKTTQGTWTLDALDHGGTYNSICIAKDGRIRIVYFDFAALRFAIN
jgi:hypothetical protein